MATPNPSPQVYIENYQRKFFKIFIKMLKFSFPQLMASGGGVGGEVLTCVQGDGQGELDRTPLNI